MDCHVHMESILWQEIQVYKYDKFTLQTALERTTNW